MHVVNLPVSGIDWTVTRPVILSIVDKVKQVTDIPLETNSKLRSIIDELQQKNSSMGDKTSNVGVGPSMSSLNLSVNETFTDRSLTTTTLNRVNSIPVFMDTDTNFKIVPVYVESKVELNIKYSSKSRTEIRDWINGIMLKLIDSMDVMLHKLEYTFKLPDGFIELINVIHELIEAQGGYGISLEEYIKRYSLNRLVLAKDAANTRMDIMVHDKQKRVLGQFKFNPTPEKMEYDKDTGKYYIEFSYEFTYNKPIGITAVYPTSVHNQLLPSIYVVPDLNVSDQDTYYDNRDVNGVFNREFESQYMVYKKGTDSALTLPYFDTWNPPDKIPYMSRIFTALCLISEDDKRTLMNLSDLDPFKFDTAIMEWIKDEEHAYMHELYKSVFNVSLIGSTGMRYDKDIMTVDNTGNIVATKDLDLRETYHVEFSIAVNLSVLPDSALRRLAMRGDVLLKVLRAINMQSYINYDGPGNNGGPNEYSLSEEQILNMAAGSGATINSLIRYLRMIGGNAINVMGSDWRDMNDYAMTVQTSYILAYNN